MEMWGEWLLEVRGKWFLVVWGYRDGFYWWSKVGDTVIVVNTNVVSCLVCVLIKEE